MERENIFWLESFYSKSIFLKFWHLFLALCLFNHFNFTVVVLIYRIHVFWWSNFPLSNRSYEKWKSKLFPFSCQTLLGKQVLSSQSCSLLIQASASSKIGVKQIKTTERKLLQRCIFHPVTQDPAPNNWKKLQHLTSPLIKWSC